MLGLAKRDFIMCKLPGANLHVAMGRLWEEYKRREKTGFVLRGRLRISTFRAFTRKRQLKMNDSQNLGIQFSLNANCAEKHKSP